MELKSSANPRCVSSGPAYKIGTLTYTKAGLATLFVWLLWGDFCFTLMEIVVPSVLPVVLKNSGASNTVIGVLVGSIATILNMLITPTVSFQSDRHRGRFGRRIPYLLWPTPFIVLFLSLIPFSPEISRCLENSAGWRQVMEHSPIGTLVLVTGVLIVLFQVANMVVASIYYYLFNDIVPTHMLSRFLALFRAVGTLAGFLFNRYVFGMAESHTRHIFISAALLYGISFLLMCWKVKEGDYDPPDPHEAGRRSLIGSIRLYFQECFTHSYYVWFFVGTALFSVSTAAFQFRVFFFRENLQLSLDAIGKLNSWPGLLSLLLVYPAGWLSDKIKPIRMVMLSTLLLIVAYLASFFLIRNESSALFWLLVMAIPGTMVGVSSLPMYAELLPRAQYGQFCSAQALLNALFMFSGNWFCGKFLDWVHDYRQTFMWSMVFSVLSFLAMLKVYFGWKKHGGPDTYEAPG